MTTDPAETSSINAASILDFQATLLSHDRFDEAATAFATELALKLGLDRVSIGLTDHGQIEVKAISHLAEIQAKHEAYRRISAAMEEAVKQAAVIIYPETTESQPRVTLSHAALARGSNNQICTIPLAHNGRLFGAIMLERNASTLFTKDETSRFESLASLIGPILLLKWKEDYPWYARIKQDFSAWKQRHLASSSTGIRLGLYGLMSAIIGLLFMPMQYNVSAPARLEGSIQRALVAPEDGYLQQTHVRPGDMVKANQVLAEFADQDLQLEKRRWQSELAQYENAYGAALAQSDRAQMVIHQSKAEEARAQLALAEEKLSRARIIAPFDGVIIKGDLRQSLGAPVQRGDVLLTIAPSNAFRLIVEVDERDISLIKTNQSGSVALISLPGKVLPFSVQRITPIASTKDARNFFEIEGALKNAEVTALRPGLEGVAKIGAEKHSLIWILTHRIIDWTRLTFWSWGL